MSATIRWDDPPAPREGRRQYKLHRVRTGRGFSGVILSKAVVGLWTHFDGRRTVPCLTGGECAMCKAGMSEKWVGYLLMMDDRHYVCIVEVTEGCWEKLSAALGAVDSLRGHRVRIFREKAHMKSRLLPEVLGKVDAGPLPDEDGIKETLVRIWGLNRIFVASSFMQSSGNRRDPSEQQD